MKRIVNSKEMKFCDNQTIQHFGVPSLVLMERAALGIVEQMPKEFSHNSRILIVCGNGNNGADGLAAARLLYQRGCEVTAVQMPDKGNRSEENRIQLEILEKYGIPVLDHMPDAESEHAGGSYACIVDALFGVGLSRAPEGDYADWIERMNRMKGYKIAVDMPSGVSSDTGEAYEACFAADLTVTFAYQKAGQLLYPGREKCGLVKVAEIGITEESWMGQRPSCYAPERKDLCKIPPRPVRSNKGTFGRVLVIAGSRNMAGAAAFCAQAAYQTGCGLVKVYTPEENREILQNTLPEAILATYPGEERNTGPNGWNEEQLLAEIRWADVIVLGPGIGLGARACRITEFVLRHSNRPMVVDADGLNHIAAQPELLEYARAAWILTPHVGEMARLCQKSIPQIQNSLMQTAVEFAVQHHLTCVLKDAATITAAADGTAYINTSGCSAMAKGGSGDVLSGVIAALLAQGMDVEAAAYTGVYLHGLAGEAAEAEKGAYSVLARDMVQEVGSVLKGIRRPGETLRTNK